MLLLTEGMKQGDGQILQMACIAIKRIRIGSQARSHMKRLRQAKIEDRRLLYLLHVMIL